MDESKFNSQYKIDIGVGKKPPIIIEDIKEPTLEDVNRVIDQAFAPIALLMKRVYQEATFINIVAKAKALIEKQSDVKASIDAPHARYNSFDEEFNKYICDLGFDGMRSSLAKELRDAIFLAISQNNSGKIIRKFLKAKSPESK